MNASKSPLRERYGTVRDGLSADRRESAARNIKRLFFGIGNIGETGTIGVYLSKGSEVSTQKLLAGLLERGKKVAAPRADPRSLLLRFYAIENGLQDCRPGHYGILEPGPGCRRVPDRDIGVLLVPGLVFDLRGYRLGYGKGYYDRYLARHPETMSVGLTYETNLAEELLPRGPQDRPVHRIITEKAVYWTGEPYL